jgi:hypothetical protein
MKSAGQRGLLERLRTWTRESGAATQSCAGGTAGRHPSGSARIEFTDSEFLGQRVRPAAGRETKAASELRGLAPGS